jgi:hypothetical protein
MSQTSPAKTGKHFDGSFSFFLDLFGFVAFSGVSKRWEFNSTTETFCKKKRLDSSTPATANRRPKAEGAPGLVAWSLAAYRCRGGVYTIHHEEVLEEPEPQANPNPGSMIKKRSRLAFVVIVFASCCCWPF